jgi:hypothetical protein
MSSTRLTVWLLSDPCGFGERQSFQKNKPHPPELAVGTNTSTKFMNRTSQELRFFHASKASENDGMRLVKGFAEILNALLKYFK